MSQNSQCWACNAPSTYFATNKAIKIVTSVGSCSNHIGELLGNITKSALRYSESVIELNVESIAF